MSVRKLFTNAALPWLLIGIVIVYCLLGYAIPDCPKGGSLYVPSPSGTHVAHRYFYACGGATVGFTQNLDLDGHTVFSTYGGGKDNVTSNWKSETELHIIYSEGLDNVQTYEPQFQDVSIRFFEISERDAAVTTNEIDAARKAAGY